MKTAFITGASSGIGQALARRLAAAGVEVALSARRVDALRELAEQIAAAGGRARVYPLDVADPLAAVETLQRADDEMGGLDLVVANAGMGREKRAGEMTWNDVGPTLAVNVVGAAATLVALAPRMAERRGGHLVGISSQAQYRPMPGASTYAASKAFLSTFLEGLRIDLRSVGVAVTDVRPGFVNTPPHKGRTEQLPMLVPVEKAAELIWRGIQRRAPRIIFPRLLDLAARSSRLVPESIFVRAVDAARRR